MSCERTRLKPGPEVGMGMRKYGGWTRARKTGIRGYVVLGAENGVASKSYVECVEVEARGLELGNVLSFTGRRRDGDRVGSVVFSFTLGGNSLARDEGLGPQRLGRRTVGLRQETRSEEVNFVGTLALVVDPVKDGRAIDGMAWGGKGGGTTNKCEYEYE